MPPIAYSLGKDSITLFVEGDLVNVDSSHRNYGKLREELLKTEEEQNLDRIKQLSSVQAMLRTFADGLVQITDSDMLFEGKAVSGHIVDKILELVQEDGDVNPYINFFLNLQKNPNKDVAGDLFKWADAGKMPITPDGCIIAFKKVKSDFTDVHTGKFDNSPGSVLVMPREKCNPDRGQTCSTGFHFCSASYLSKFGGQKVVAVKVNPADVTAIPRDYNNAKGRCCRYEVIQELSDASAAKHDVWAKPVADLENSQEFPPEFFKEKAKPKRKAVVTKKDGEAKKKPEPKIKVGNDGKVKAAKIAKTPTPKVVTKKVKATTAEAKAVVKQVKAAVKKVVAPKPKAADNPETVKDIVKAAVEKAKKPKTAKAKPFAVSKTPTPFKNQAGEFWAEGIIRHAKKDVEAKILTMKAAAEGLKTSPSTLSGWFKKV